MLKISLTTSGLLDKSTLEAWARQKRTAIHQVVATGMRAGGKEITEAVRHQMRRDFSVKKPAFVNSLRPKVYDRNPDKLPALLIGSRIPWLGIHVRGGTLSGRMLIPLTEEGRRIGRRAFKRVIEALLRSGNAYFIRKNGQVILMAENLKENTSVLSRSNGPNGTAPGRNRSGAGRKFPLPCWCPKSPSNAASTSRARCAASYRIWPALSKKN